MNEPDEISRARADRSERLRQRAEERLRRITEETTRLPLPDVRALVHELRVHQVELEVQNEELRESQLALAEARDRFVDLFDFAPIGYATVDVDGRILEANLAMSRLLGVSRRDLLGSALGTFVAPRSLRDWDLHRRAAFESDSKQVGEVTLHARDGSSRCVRVESLRRGQGEAPELVRCALIDVTELTDARRQLEASSIRYRRLTEAVSDFVYRMRVGEGQVPEMIEGVNCESVTGYPPEKLLERPGLWAEIVPESDRDAVRGVIDRAFAGEPVAPIEHRLLHASGMTRWVESSLTAERDGQGRVVAIDGVLRDITARKELELALQRLNQTLELQVEERTQRIALLAKAVECFADGVLITGDDLDWPGPEILYVNEAMCRITGYSAAELLGETPRILQGEHTDPRERRQMCHTLEAGRTCHCEVTNHRKDGTPYIAELVIVPIFDAQGRRTNFVSVHRDVTERRQTERRLERWAQIFHHAAFGVAVLGADRRTLESVNPAFASMLGTSVDGLRGRSLEETLRGKEWRAIEGNLEVARETLHHTFETTIRSRRERAFVALLDVTVVRDEEGSALHHIVYLQDISELRRAQEQARETADRLRAIVETAADAIITVDQDGQITSFNPAAERMFGRSAEEAIGQSFEVLLPTDQDQRAEMDRLGIDARKRPLLAVGREVVVRRRDGSLFPVELAVSEVVHEEDRLYVSILRDITERKRIQERLLESERLAAIGTAMAALAHESRNALARGRSGLSMLERRLRDRPDLAEYLARTERAQGDLERLYEEVRTYAVPTKPILEHCDVAAELEAAWEDLKTQRTGRLASLKIAVDGDPVCEADLFQIRQVLRNVLDNALAAADPLTIEARIGDGQLGGRPAVHLSITDDGPGFPPEVATRAFEPFFTAKVRGTGLGLSIAKRIVNAHGGEIAVGTARERGAEILIDLPRRPVP